ncbi:hypothetical protein PC129_g2677 [Phytophthora cactorum]|uniref:Ubiquitin-like domain-containing protein n=2 Tax=Phytophthora cactorum TaxID=29920 RepID=A0A329SQ61_9STRA|nr:hypothetical protein Pcac1_g10739 [Phytophthora cactorum]KAG2838756.1 hypothetical protein PC111_g4132 [Phytophthora cactorum]KAG2846733.1 hypothetical protein PC112_g1337 [Phytophthora cactorum]KAG2863695.1 hypothetical protein PC113_g5217 [Phytophthora cactorum]KAG2933860.1 hypothetical protein PC114_g1276 [Phytophthora cactorum]
MSTPPTVASMPEPAAEPPVSAESAQLSLKVRTLDQRTYPITICAAASVPQLKELVATETGVTLARQRLIYRGRVLKNDQTLAAYSLEDGHVLHLVVRAVPPVDAADQTPASATPAPDPNAGQGAPPAGGRAPASFQYVGSDTFLDDLVRMSRSRLRQPPPPRDNDEPDPTMGRPGGGGLPSRVVMGATISMPEGADVTMPFLNSMMANLVTQVEGGEGLTAARGRRRATFSREVLGGGTAAEMEAATARALRHHHRNRDGSGRQRHGRRSSSSSADRQRALRVRTGVRLESVRATLDDASLDFPAELSALPQGDTNAAMAELQQQVEMLLALVQRFGPRLRLLSAALAQRDRMGVANGAAAGPAPAESTAVSSTGSAAAPTESSTASVGPTAAAPGSTTAATEAASDSTPNTGNAAAATTAEPAVSTRPVLRAIEALQTIGESTDMLARMARHAFVRQSALLGEPLSRRLSAYTVASDRIQAALDQGTTATGGTAGATGGDRATRDAVQGSSRAARLSSALNSRRFRINATDLVRDRSSPAARATSVAPAVTPGSTHDVPVDLTASGSGATSPAPGPATSTQSPTRSRRTDAVPNDVSGPLPPAGTHISISGMGLPLMSSVVFPFSLAAGLGGSHATTTWNLADCVSRLTSELPISTLYGVMAGDATHLHHILAHIGFALFSGVDVPRVTRPSIRTWAQDLVAELRRLLRLHSLPTDVVDPVTGPEERRAALGNELLRVMEPFIPDLVDYLVRATSASRAAAFGTSSATFLRTMAQQIVRQLRVYARGDSTESEDDSDERLKRLLRGLLVWLGVNEHIASFVVDSLLCWTEGDNASSRRGRTRQREETGSEDGATGSPATKRRRE